EIAGRRIPKANHADQPVVRGVGDGHRVRELLRRVHAVALTHGNPLAREAVPGREGSCGRKGGDTEDAFHLRAIRIAAISCCWVTTISCAMRRSCSFLPY